MNSSASRLYAQSMTETELQDAVVQMANLFGWRVCHFRPAKTDKGWRTPVQGHIGYPDITLVRERIMFVELKSDKGKLTHDQMEWARAIEDAGGEWHVWRPAEWHDRTIERILR